MATGPTEVTQSPETGDTVEECTGKQLFSDCIADLEVRYFFLWVEGSVISCFAVWFYFLQCKKKKCFCQLAIL